LGERVELGRSREVGLPAGNGEEENEDVAREIELEVESEERLVLEEPG
jgi:hypothetical protein